MVCVFHLETALLDHRLWTLLVWDRNSGDLVRILWLGSSQVFLTPLLQVLELSTTDCNELVSPRVIFLDEFRILVSTRDSATNAPKLTVFNTLIPQGRSLNLRQLSLPPRYSNGHALVHADHDRSLGALNKDGPLITDPAQAIFLVEIPRLRIFLVVQIQTMIESVCSAGTGVEIPWHEWGRGAVIMLTPQASYDSPICVHGTHVMVVKTPSWHGLGDYNRVRTFDFGRRGCNVLPLLDKEGGGTERKATFEDGREFVLDEYGDVAWWGGMRSLGDGNLFRPVSGPFHYSGKEL